MQLEFHPLVSSDVSRIIQYYDEVAGPRLADDFYAELRACLEKASKSPELYSIRERDLRRANLERFPYHFLFRIVNERVRLLVVRHHSREPSAGTRRR